MATEDNKKEEIVKAGTLRKVVEEVMGEDAAEPILAVYGVEWDTPDDQEVLCDLEELTATLKQDNGEEITIIKVAWGDDIDESTGPI